MGLSLPSSSQAVGVGIFSGTSERHRSRRTQVVQRVMASPVVGSSVHCLSKLLTQTESLRSNIHRVVAWWKLIGLGCPSCVKR